MQLLSLLTLSLLAAYAQASTFASAERPNVILLLADDLGYGDLGAHGNPQLQTPSLDRLSRESVRFTNHHVAPMCSPTRGELMSGFSAFRNGASAVAQGRSMVRRELSIMPDFFRDAGYATAHFGKWHLGDNYPFRAHDRGFDFSISTKGFGTSSLADHWQNDAFDDYYWRNGDLIQLEGYNTDVFFDEAMSWMSGQTKPFFVYLATTASHEPHYVDSGYEKPYEELTAALAAFYGVTTQLDENVGRLLSFLDRNDLSRNTILIYMTDNGTVERTDFYNAGMRGRKASLYEGGHRVPLFIRWPARTGSAGRDIHTLTHSTDLLPTLIDLADLGAERGVFDGQSLVPLLDGEQPKSFADRKLVIQYGVEFNPWDSAVLWKSWRLVKGEELFDLSADPSQERDIAATRPDIVRDLRTHYESWMHQTRQVMARKNFIVVGSPYERVSTLSAADWVGPYCGEWGELEPSAAPLFGHWNIEPYVSGDYAFSLYLFPPESETPLSHPFRTVPARPVAQARLLLNDEEYVVQTPGDAANARFNVPLEKGEGYQAEGQLLDEAGKPLWGAVYVVVEPLRDTH
jgi:arylsulfatase